MRSTPPRLRRVASPVAGTQILLVRGDSEYLWSKEARICSSAKNVPAAFPSKSDLGGIECLSDQTKTSGISLRTAEVGRMATVCHTRKALHLHIRGNSSTFFV